MKRTALVTGAGNGIGRCTLVHLRTNGWRVIGLDKDEEALAELKAKDTLVLACDVGSELDVDDAFDRMGAWLDGDALHLLVNNAGIADPYSGPIEELSLRKWQGWIDASLTAAFLVTRAAVPLLRRAAGTASIVNISSTRAKMSEAETFAYTAAKGGLSALTHALAVSLGPDIRANAILPGWIETAPWQKQAEREEPAHSDEARAQHPVGRIGLPEDIAAAVAWLAGDQSGFITSQEIVIDGGMTRKMIYTA